PSRATRTLPSFPTRRSSDLPFAVLPAENERRLFQLGNDGDASGAVPVLLRNTRANLVDHAGRGRQPRRLAGGDGRAGARGCGERSEEHTSELQSPCKLVRRL